MREISPSRFVFAAILALGLLLPAATEGAPRFHTLRRAPKGSVPPPDFALPDLEGKTHRLSDMRGKVVLLAFFATWCPLCNEEMPKLVRLHEALKDRGFTVLGVSIDATGPGLVRKWSAQKKLTYPILHDRSSSTRRTHNVRFVPTLYLLDRQLKVAAWAVGRVDWERGAARELIERLLSSGAQARLPAAGRTAQRLP